VNPPLRQSAGALCAISQTDKNETHSKILKMIMDMDRKYKLFLEKLNLAKEEGLVDLLYRGESKKFAFNNFNLDASSNNIEQFKERLFFFGDKAKSFWNDKIMLHSSGDFEVNEISDSVFGHIFSLFNNLIKTAAKEKSKQYFEKNKTTTDFFANMDNCETFIQRTNSLLDKQKMLYRNFCLSIIHQLGESPYKENSHLVSSSQKRSEAKKFSKNGVIINFWDLKLKQHKMLVGSMPIFRGRPYEKQKEESIFAAILPHYIYSFEYEGKIYANPALSTSENLDEVISYGFEIEQKDFLERLKKETKYKKGVTTDGENFEALK
jgi:hypothetical protein